MSDYGLKLWDAQGNVKLDLTDKITRLRYSTIVNPLTDGDITLSDIGGHDTVQFAIALDEGGIGDGNIPHKVTRTGTLIEWEYQTVDNGFTDPDDTSAKSLILVFLYT